MLIVKFTSFDKVAFSLRWLIYKRLFSDSSIGDAEDGEEYDDPFAGASDTMSLASERYDKDDEAHSEGM